MKSNNINIVFYWDSIENNFIKWKKAFQNIDPKFNCYSYEDPKSINADVALVWHPPKRLLEKFTKLKGVINLGQGVDYLLKPGIVPQSLPIVRLVDPEMSRAIASWASLQVLYEVCGFKTYIDQQKQNIWKAHPLENSSYDWTIGVLGLGKIGSYVAKSFVPFGFKVLGWSKNLKSIENIHCFSGTEGLKKVLSNSRILVCLLPLTKETKYIISEKTLKKMPKGATIINAGRGGHINEKHLLKMIELGHIKNAYLDVFENEPLPIDHPFWNHNKIIIWPHVAGQTNIATTINQIINASYCLMEGKKAPNTIDKIKEY